MQKSQQTSKEKNQNNNKGLNHTQEELIKGKNDPVQKEDISKKKNCRAKAKRNRIKIKNIK
jgi:hypothetical protein